MGNKDNRIPDIIKYYSKKSDDESILAFLKFTDFFENYDIESKDWIVVARYSKNSENSLFIYSALASIDKQDLKKVLSKSNWEIHHTTFGLPAFYTIGGKNNVNYDSGISKCVNGTDYYPFIFYMETYGYKSESFELLQNFIMYHRLFLDEHENQYNRLDDDGTIIPVVKIISNDTKLEILVDVHHLKDYLAANKLHLIRYHDHRRGSKVDISKMNSEEIVEEIISKDTCFFSLLVAYNNPILEQKSWSRLYGKDIVSPYDEPDERHFLFIKSDYRKEYVTYIVDRDSQGNDIEETCNEQELSNYYVDTGKLHYLTPVFFERKVLSKYYKENSRYKVENSLISCLHLWNISYDTNDDGLVNAYLGDLGHLPYKEQMHWRQYNVPPKGTISEDRWKRDFLAEPTSPTNDLVYNFKYAYERVQKAVTELFGEELFLRLKKDDEYLYDSLRIPLNNEWDEFDGQILALAKIIPDSINVKLIEKLTKQKSEGKSINLLGEFLKNLNGIGDRVSKITDAIHVVQTIRSSGIGHRKGDNFYKSLKRFDLINKPNHLKLTIILENLSEALLIITEIITKQT